VQVVYNFGREDTVSRQALERLAASVTRFLDPGAALAASADGLEFTEPRPLGGTWALDAIWSRLGTGVETRRLLKGRKRDDKAERTLFALVANRALAPSSKLAASRWISEDGLVTGLGKVSGDACYRAMDWLLEIRRDLEKKVFDSLVTLLNLEVDVLFFDTTSTCFVTEDEDGPVARDDHGNPLTSENADSDDGKEREPAPFRTWGKSKDHRGDLPQAVIGMAVTRDGIPVRVWCWPGDTNDSALIRQVKDDMREWVPSKIIWVAGRGFTSAGNRRYLRKGGGSYITGEKIRSGTDAAAALSRQGRYKDVAGNLEVKEVRIAEDERFIICFNPGAAERDAAVRAKMIALLEDAIRDPGQLSEVRRGEIRGVISARPGLKRYLRITPGGLPRVDAAKAKAGENLDGKYLLRTAGPKLSAEDIATGYKQLPEVERGWRDMKQVIDLRPVFHRREDRIRAHVLLCWLALLLARIAENACDDTWPESRRELDKIHIGTFAGPAGTLRRRTEITKRQRDILKALDIKAPPRIYQLKPAVEE
jgi:Transposase DDE domain